MQITGGTVAVITGGASGIGKSCALEFARRGADVVVADINEARLDETHKELADLGVRSAAVICDVTKDEDLHRLRDEAVSAMGHVDLVMNNAGVALLGPPERVPMDEWRRVMDINVFGLIRGAQAFVPYFQERGHGYVVNTASVAGLYAYSWDSIPYITSKFGAYGFTEGLHVYLKPQGIGVSVLCPGLVASNFGESARIVGMDDPSGWVHLPEDMGWIDPAVIGPMVADGVEAEQFLIFTHPEDPERIASRHRDIEAALAHQVATGPMPPKL
jgi:NAD(P)-dependent dehydrogenase (short-subunit alcohol dehydrogenase family)